MSAKNKQGGIDVESKESKERAKEVDLLTMPKGIEGTNCANCKFVEIIDPKESIGFCKHPKVLLPVSKRMCCALWDAVGSLRIWKK